MKKSYLERAKKFISMLAPYLTDCDNESDFYRAIRVFNELHHRHVHCSSGVSRVAFITSDYAIKLEYNLDNVEYVGGGEKEVQMYAIAEAEGFAYLFAKVTRYDYNGFRFYIMPRIYGINRYPYDYAQEYMTDEEIAFCNKYDIRDLHSENYGFRNKHVCLIDYASCLWFD